MLLPLSWLSDYIDLQGVSHEKLADLLTMSGSEVKKIHQKGGYFDNIVVAEIKAVNPHPNADKIQLATVTIDGKNEVEVVCGAPNIAAGQKVPYAKIGAKVGDITIEKIKIRGVESSGMLCSGRELKLTEDHSGILVLDPKVKVGTPLSEVIESDVIYDLEITPNRPDCLSILGLAREASCVLDKPIKKDNYNQKIKASSKKSTFSIDIQEKDKCSRYAGLLIKNVKITQSPPWLQNRLRAALIRPINSVVDITNYLLFETGQPLHAFDADKIGDQKIIIRNAKKDEKIITLDGNVRSLNPNILVIANSKKALALAGIMGGKETEVDENTTNIFLESASFDKMNIRKGSEYLALRSEASARFEKGLDISMVDKAIWQAAEMIIEIAGGEIIEYSDELTDEGKKRIKAKNIIKLDGSEIKRVLGVEVSQKETERILNKLGFGVKKAEKNKKNWSLEIEIPTWRGDILEKFDLIEEVGRIYGYAQLPTSIPSGSFAIPELQIKPDLDQKIQQNMVSLGFHEVYNYSIVNPQKLQNFELEKEKAIKLTSPLADFEFIRFSLLPDLLTNLQQNIFKNPGLKNLKLFEYSRVFLPQKGKELPLEPTYLSGVGFEKFFFDLKGDISFLLENLGIGEIVFSDISEDINQWEKEVISIFEKENLSFIKIAGKTIGFIGNIKKSLLKTLDILFPFGKEHKNVVGFELNASLIKTASSLIKKFEPISKFPPVLFDCAFIVDQKVKAGEILADLKKLASECVEILPDLFDVYIGKNIEPSKKSLAFSIQFIPFEGTLKEDEIKAWQNKVISMVENKYSGVLRNK